MAFATIVGTSIEWYDCFLCAAASGLIFNQRFFGPLGSTLIAMGAATALIGFLPTFESAGVLAPILLIALRSIQGISAGGEWGWRVPFFLSIVLVFMGSNAAGYMTTGGYIQNYATDPAGPIGLERGPVLWAVAASAVSWLVFTIIAGAVSDRIGRRNTYILGWILLLAGIFSLFPLVNTGSVGMLLLGLVVLTIGLGFTYGQQPAMYAELFPSSFRFSGVSVSYAIGSILGGGVPGRCRRARPRRNPAAARSHRNSAGPDHEDEQAVSPIIGIGAPQVTCDDGDRHHPADTRSYMN